MSLPSILINHVYSLTPLAGKKDDLERQGRFVHINIKPHKSSGVTGNYEIDVMDCPDGAFIHLYMVEQDAELFAKICNWAVERGLIERMWTPDGEPPRGFFVTEKLQVLTGLMSRDEKDFKRDLIIAWAMEEAENFIGRRIDGFWSPPNPVFDKNKPVQIEGGIFMERLENWKKTPYIGW